MSRVLHSGIILGLFAAIINFANAASNGYGTLVGPLSQLHHGVSGTVYAVDSRTLFIRNFNYDGEGPAAYFYVGSGKRISNDGALRLRDERGSTGVIKKYRNKDIVLSLPEGKTLRDIQWFSVWCDEFSVNFGDVTIPKNLDYPKPQKIGSLRGVHGVSSDHIVIVDAQTLLVPNFSYDGEAPDAKFWVGHGIKPTPNGLRIPDENGRESPLIKYDKKTIVLTLPSDLTVFDIGHFGVWCEAFTVDFGHVLIPENLNVPPSLKMLGISPQSKLNCEVLYDDLAFEVRWAVAGESVVVQLVAKLENNEYMSFGISPDHLHTVMVGADVVVAWVDKETGKGYASDYYLDAKSQCSGQRGSCPDTRLMSNSNSIRLLNAAMVNGYSIVTFQRPLKATDKFDLPISLNGSQAIVWAIGPLNQRQEVSFHSQYTRGDRFIDFGRQAVWNCPLSEGDMKLPDDDVADELYDEPAPVNVDSHNRNDNANRRHQQEDNRRQQQLESNRRGEQTHSDNRKDSQSQDRPRRPVPTPKPVSRNGAWFIPPIQCFEPEDGVFYAQMGPTGGKQGYPAITGHVGWGISWYINGLLIPEINVVRGKTYTFVVEGGNDPEVPAKYHPFYITDDSVGGYEYKTEEEKSNVKIYAGVQRSRSGAVVPTGVGRICNWTPDLDGPPADEYTSFGAYQRSLSLKCEAGEPGIITWTPDEKTPDTVYYQCFTHRYLGWRINVHDYCDNGAQSSEIDEVFAEPEESNVDDADTLVPDASIRHETKILPNEIFLLQHEKDLIKNHNMNGQPPKIQFDLNKNSDISKIIADGIKAAEALEESIAQSKGNYSYKFDGQLKQYGKHRPSSYSTLPPQDIQMPDEDINPNPPKFQSHPLSSYNRPPNEPPQFHRPIKSHNRRPPPSPVFVERRRPYNGPPQRPFPPSAGQQSIMVNHYKKPGSQFIRPFIKQKKPIKSHAPFLLLGQPTEIGSLRKNFEQKPLIPPAPVQKVKNGVKPPNKAPPPPPQSQQHPQQQQQHQLQPHQQQQHQQQLQHQQQQQPSQKHQYRENPPVKINSNGKKPQNHINQPIPLRKKPNRESVYKNRESTKITYKAPFEVIDDSLPSASVLAHNSGFKPSSVIVEGGFRPILRRRNDETDDEIMINTNRRRDDNISDIDEAMEGDALFINQNVENQAFEPMFIPSPPDSLNSSQKNRMANSDLLGGDLHEMEIEEGDDKLAMAGERVDAYYLPPDTRKKHTKVYPEGSVVTYDGKAVLDTSLVNLPPPPPPPSPSHSNGKLVYTGHLSRSEQLVRNSPQYGPYTGEMPPPIPDFISSDGGPQFAQLNSPAANKTQIPITEYSNPLTSNTNPISTKLSLLSSPSSSVIADESSSNDDRNINDEDSNDNESL